MRIVLLESSTQDSIAPLLRSWGFALVTAATLADLGHDATASDPLLFVFNHPDLQKLSQLLHDCGRMALGRPFRTLVIVDRTQPEAISHALSAGANDLLCAPFEPAELRLRITTGNQLLDYTRKAHYDYLSGLLNRGAMTDLLSRELQRSRRANTPLSVAMCDIDRFKKVNDTYGHLAGDAAIKTVANRLASQVRPYDYVGRYGGDEFIIALIHCNPGQAMDICERMRSSVAADPVPTDQGPVHTSISLGLVVLDPIRETDVSRIIHYADIALYEAKNSGRNRVILATQMP